VGMHTAASRGRGGRRRGAGASHEINVTPLIDVMLVLLVIFMVTAPMLTTGVKVDLPKAKSSVLKVDDSKLMVTVTKDEHVFLGKEDITADFENKLKANVRLAEERELYIQGDEGVRYGTVLRVMAAARAAGVDKLGMVTDPLVVK
jgi:biopolymer transport protein TolR